MLLEAPINGLLSPSVATAKSAYGDIATHTTTNPVASNGLSNGAGHHHNHTGLDQTESHLGPHAINSGNTPPITGGVHSA